MHLAYSADAGRLVYSNLRYLHARLRELDGLLRRPRETFCREAEFIVCCASVGAEPDQRIRVPCPKENVDHGGEKPIAKTRNDVIVKAFRAVTVSRSNDEI